MCPCTSVLEALEVSKIRRVWSTATAKSAALLRNCGPPCAAARCRGGGGADEGEEDDAPAVESNVEQRRVRPIAIGFTGLSVYVRPSMKPILSDVTGRFRSGAYESHHAAGAPRARFV